MDIRMYIIVNKSLQMSQGKIASQAAHAACDVVETLLTDKKLNPYTIDKYRLWTNGSYTKIVLQSEVADMLKCIQDYSDKKEKIWCIGIMDEGRTEIDKNSFTTIAFVPMLKDDTPMIIKRMRLL